jgi:preprotein translocase subunit YajC
MDWNSTLAFAGQVTEAAPKPAAEGNPYGMLPIIVIIMALFYFMVIRPQKKGQQQAEEMRSSVKKGDKVKSIGGILGTVVAVDTTNNVVSVQVDRNVKLDFDRSAIATVIRKEDAKGVKDTGKQKTIEAEPTPTEAEATK